MLVAVPVVKEEEEVVFVLDVGAATALLASYCNGWFWERSTPVSEMSSLTDPWTCSVDIQLVDDDEVC